jgi:hypothetical protein
MKSAIQKTKKHPIEKYVGVLTGRGLRSDDLIDAMRGTGKPFRAKRKIPSQNL